MSQPPPGSFSEYGADPSSLRTDVQRMDIGTGVWVNGTPGMQLEKRQPAARDGLVRRVPVRLLHRGRELAVGSVVFGADGKQRSAELSSYYAAVAAKLLPADPVVKAFLVNYLARCLPDIDAVQQQRECPVQFPHWTGAVICPGDAEVLYDAAVGSISSCEQRQLLQPPKEMDYHKVDFFPARPPSLKLPWWRELWNRVAWHLGL